MDKVSSVIIDFEVVKRYNFKFTLKENEVNAASQVSLGVAIDNSVGNDGYDDDNTEEGLNSLRLQ